MFSFLNIEFMYTVRLIALWTYFVGLLGQDKNIYYMEILPIFIVVLSMNKLLDLKLFPTINIYGLIFFLTKAKYNEVLMNSP